MVNYPRTLYATGFQILDMPGSRVYHIYGVQYTWLTVGHGGFQPSPGPHNHYEVSVIPTSGGSWWLATGTTNAAEWQPYGGGELVVGDAHYVQTGGIYRPSYLYYWISAAGLAHSGLVPGQSKGWIDGYFPTAGPQ